MGIIENIHKKTPVILEKMGGREGKKISCLIVFDVKLLTDRE